MASQLFIRHHLRFCNPRDFCLICCMEVWMKLCISRQILTQDLNMCLNFFMNYFISQHSSGSLETLPTSAVNSSVTRLLKGIAALLFSAYNKNLINNSFDQLKPNHSALSLRKSNALIHQSKRKGRRKRRRPRWKRRKKIGLPTVSLWLDAILEPMVKKIVKTRFFFTHSPFFIKYNEANVPFSIKMNKSNLEVVEDFFISYTPHQIDYTFIRLRKCTGVFVWVSWYGILTKATKKEVLRYYINNRIVYLAYLEIQDPFFITIQPTRKQSKRMSFNDPKEVTFQQVLAPPTARMTTPNLNLSNCFIYSPAVRRLKRCNEAVIRLHIKVHPAELKGGNKVI
ncbi:hypothetical protein EGR_03883 [Echinococcus granulosus]|uniref:Uncharacterized protein n=1 Tax=Echinococcus granulosus TaxID=6210 RepID=W6UJI5_ECHGR|nr:hypothetical protein EGR_03883 [Echinococcus granulosus]EUB61208.1 hypothetical protein EGR_03883 [Echinococcus granulosus]